MCTTQNINIEFKTNRNEKLVLVVDESQRGVRTICMTVYVIPHGCDTNM